MPDCNNELRARGAVTPRTCAKCGLGPCHANASVHGQKKAAAHPLDDGHGILGFSDKASMPLQIVEKATGKVVHTGTMVGTPAALAAVRATGLSKACEAAMELAIVRPDLLTPDQVQTIAQALKTATVGKANLSNLEAAMRQAQMANEAAQPRPNTVPDYAVAHEAELDRAEAEAADVVMHRVRLSNVPLRMRP